MRLCKVWRRAKTTKIMNRQVKCINLFDFDKIMRYNTCMKSRNSLQRISTEIATPLEIIRSYLLRITTACRVSGNTLQAQDSPSNLYINMLYTNILRSLQALFVIIILVSAYGIVQAIKETGNNMNYYCDWFSQEQHLAPSNCF